jgi:hypothetical protein
MSVHPIIKQIIDRDCHVAMTAREVVRHVISRLREGYKTFRELPKPDRRRFVEDCVRRHRENFRLYANVMSGGRRRHKNAETVFNPFPPESLSGKELCRLMRKHRVTIAELALRTGITQKRIRQVREAGISDPFVVRDWIQAITRSDPGPIPEQYRIGNPTEETECSFCGCPSFLGETAYSYLSDVFCSRHCCRKSRGWE